LIKERNHIIKITYSRSARAEIRQLANQADTDRDVNTDLQLNYNKKITAFVISAFAVEDPRPTQRMQIG